MYIGEVNITGLGTCMMQAAACGALRLVEAAVCCRCYNRSQLDKVILNKNISMQDVISFM